jgi:hypothetical protein
MRFDATGKLTAACAALAVMTLAGLLPPASAQEPISMKPISTAAIPLPALRKRAEEIYADVRNALYTQNYDEFMRLTIPAGKGKPPPREVFSQIALRMLDDYPVLESLNFVKVERSGDWIGYYAEDRISDPKRTFIYGFRFKREYGDLKMSGQVAVQDIPHNPGQIPTLNEIDLNPKFKLPGQKGAKG